MGRSSPTGPPARRHHKRGRLFSIALISCLFRALVSCLFRLIRPLEFRGSSLAPSPPSPLLIRRRTILGPYSRPTLVPTVVLGGNSFTLLPFVNSVNSGPLGLTDYTLTCWDCGTNPSTLERERAGAHRAQIDLELSLGPAVFLLHSILERESTAAVSVSTQCARCVVTPPTPMR